MSTIVAVQKDTHDHLAFHNQKSLSMGQRYDTHPSRTSISSTDRRDNYIDHHITELEKCCDRLCRPGSSTQERGTFLTKVAFFIGTIPTDSSRRGCGFANRVYVVHFRVHRMFSESSLQPLQAFAERQSKMMIETANLHTHVHDPMNDIAEQWTNKTQEWNLMQEAKHLDDGLAKETSEHSEPAKPAATTPKENIEEGVVSQVRPSPSFDHLHSATCVRGSHTNHQS